MNYLSRTLGATLALILVILAPGPARGQFFFNSVNPTNTDSEITPLLSPEALHRVFPPKPPARNRLFLFLPGTGSRPSSSDGILKAATNLGLHAIGLVYVNTTNVSLACVNDCDCYEKIRMEIVSGTNYSAEIEVSRPDSIENRLNKLLRHLHTVFPSQGWGQFLDAQTNAVWSNIIVAGHSQGAGHAAMLGHTRRVNRVLMFSWIDRCVSNFTGVTAPWISTNNPTPADRYFGFIHTNDAVVLSEWAEAGWIALGLDAFGPVEYFENVPDPPHGPTHRYLTALEPRGTNLPQFVHNSTVVDVNTPTNASGQFVYEPLWRYMMTGPTVIPNLSVNTNGSPNSVTIAWPGVEDVLYYLDRSTNMIAWDLAAGPITGRYETISTNQPDTAPMGSFRLRLGY